MGTDLASMRERLEELAADDGAFVVACCRTGERPFPVAGLRFADRETAVRAADLARNYRSTLAQYDPRTPRYDLVVHETADGLPASDAPSRADACHDVVGAVFEALSAAGHRDAERAVLDGYFAAAEATTDVDDLSVVLLRCAATALDDHLDDADLAAVLRDAAARSDVTPADATPTRALSVVAGAGLVGGVSPTADGWAFEPTVRADGAAVTLPVAVAVLSARPDADVSFAASDGRVELRLAGGPAGLATASLQ